MGTEAIPDLGRPSDLGVCINRALGWRAPWVHCPGFLVQWDWGLYSALKWGYKFSLLPGWGYRTGYTANIACWPGTHIRQNCLDQTRFPGQKGLLAQLCKWAEPLAGISALVLLSADCYKPCLPYISIWSTLGSWKTIGPEGPFWCSTMPAWGRGDGQSELFLFPF